MNDMMLGVPWNVVSFQHYEGVPGTGENSRMLDDALYHGFDPDIEVLGFDTIRRFVELSQRHRGR